MERPNQFLTPPLAFHVASVVLGAIGLIPFFLPILGAPISALGAIAGIVAGGLACCGRIGSLRWALVVVAVSTLAFAMNIGIAFAPRGFESAPTGPQTVSVPDVPYVAPPSRRFN